MQHFFHPTKSICRPGATANSTQRLLTGMNFNHCHFDGNKVTIRHTQQTHTHDSFACNHRFSAAASAWQCTCKSWKAADVPATAAAVAIVSSTDLPHGITGVKRLREEDAARTCWHSQLDVSIIDAAIDQAQIQKRAAEQIPNTRGHNVGWRRGAAPRAL